MFLKKSCVYFRPLEQQLGLFSPNLLLLEGNCSTPGNRLELMCLFDFKNFSGFYSLLLKNESLLYRRFNNFSTENLFRRFYLAFEAHNFGYWKQLLLSFSDDNEIHFVSRKGEMPLKELISEHRKRLKNFYNVEWIEMKISKWMVWVVKIFSFPLFVLLSDWVYKLIQKRNVKN